MFSRSLCRVIQIRILLRFLLDKLVAGSIGMSAADGVVVPALGQGEQIIQTAVVFS